MPRMSLYICSLNSGSNGNCYYIGNGQEAVLIDAGLSCREIERRMNRAELDIAKVKAVFISHEHTDHISAVEVLSRKHRLPVYITPATMKNGNLQLEAELTYHFVANEPVQIGDLSITAFRKSHDAIDPHSFIVEGNGIVIGVLTDIGAPCDEVIRNFRKCHAAFLEANYDERMLAEGHYPRYLKKRISSDEGHLSNKQALELFLAHRPPFMSQVLLAHLSRENNRPQLAEQFFRRHAGDVEVAVASRDGESAVYHIWEHAHARPAEEYTPPAKVAAAASGAAQLSLFPSAS